MSAYKTYYQNFMGLNDFNPGEKALVVASHYRELPLNEQYFYPILMSEFEGKAFCSCTNEYLELCRLTFDGTEASVHELFAKVNNTGNFTLKQMRRYTQTQPIEQSTAVTLTETCIRNLNFNLSQDKEAYILRKKKILEDQRQFAIIKDHQIASTAFISEIHAKGCNIVVYSNPSYRGLGYGKEVVKACLLWCQARDLVPIYLVNEDNAASIHLAESLNLSLMNKEWCIAY